MVGCSSMNVMHKHAIPAQSIVENRIHFLPTHMMIKMAIAIAGISTRPASAWKKIFEKKKRRLNMFYVEVCFNFVFHVEK